MIHLIDSRSITFTYLIVLFFCCSECLHASEEFSWEWDDSDTIQHNGIYSTNYFKSPVESWELKKNQHGIRLYLGEIKGTDIKAFKGVVQINSSINSLLAVMVNTENCPQWVHNCESSFLVYNNGLSDQYVYQSYDLMLGVGKRDYLFYVSATVNPSNQAVTINMEATPNYCRNNTTSQCQSINQSDNIMIQTSIGTYRLEPMSDGSTLVTWEQFTDPAGDLPIWIVNQLVLNVPFMTLKGLQDVVKEEKYHQADNILEKEMLLTN